jgi:ribosomal protein L37E
MFLVFLRFIFIGLKKFKKKEKDTMLCTRCGIKIDADSNFCKSCGDPVAVSKGIYRAAAAATAQPVINQEVKKEKPVLLIVVLSCLLVAGSAVGAVFLFHGSVADDLGYEPRNIYQNIYQRSFVDDIHIPLNRMLIGVRVGDKWGYINTQGEIVIEPQFDYIRPFEKNGLARVFVGEMIYLDWDVRGPGDGKWGFVNTQGEIVIEPQFDDVW